MAQQTQVNRVAVFYTAWLKKFPTLARLAESTKGEVLRQWSGLGYNSRALRLHALAIQLSEHNRGKLPRTIEGLLKLPGIGKYTAHAVACFAFGAEIPVVDVNVRRIFSRIFWNVRSADDLRPEKEIWDIAGNSLPPAKSAEWNQALMDLGALVCTARNPRCGSCPVAPHCSSAFSKAFGIKSAVKRKPEPSFKGVPRRIYRGRILKALHERPLTLFQLGERIVDRFHPQDIRWIMRVLETMEQEMLISVRGNGNRKRVCIAQ